MRATILTIGSVTAETSRLTPTGQFGMRSARRVSGLTRQGSGPTSGQRSFWNSRYDDSDSPRPSEAPTLRSHVRKSTSPRPWRWRSGATMTSMPHEPRTCRPRDRHLHRHRRVLPDDGRAFARNPDLGLAARVVRVAPVLPVPAQPAGLGGVVAEHTPIQRVDGAPVFRLGSDRCRPLRGRRPSGQHVLHVTDQRVLRQRAVAQPAADGGRQPPDGRRRRAAPRGRSAARRRRSAAAAARRGPSRAGRRA